MRGLAKAIRETRSRPGSAGLPLNPWDYYELALQAVEDLGGVSEAEEEHVAEPEDPSPRRPPPPQRRRLTREEVVETIREAVETGEEVDFSDADLSEADLTGANLRGANLEGAIVDDALR